MVEEVAGRRLLGASSGRAALARLRLQARDTEAESEFHLCIREWAADPRPHRATRHYRGISQYSSADGFSGGAAVHRNAVRGSRCQRASFEDRSALPTAAGGARFCPRLGEDGAYEGASGAAVRE